MFDRLITLHHQIIDHEQQLEQLAEQKRQLAQEWFQEQGQQASADRQSFVYVHDQHAHVITLSKEANNDDDSFHFSVDIEQMPLINRS